MNSPPDEIPGGNGSDQMAELAELVQRLVDEVAVLRHAVDDLRDELTHELRRMRDEASQPPLPFHLTSMPRDPLAPDFHQRVDAVDQSVFAEPPQTADGLLHRLMADPVAGRLTADEWGEDQEFPPGAVVEIEPSIFDWFAEYPVTVQQGTDWFVVDDGLGNFFLLWHRAEQCFVRLLTDDEQQAFTRLTGIAQELEPENEQEDVPPKPGTGSVPPADAQQQTLW